MSIKYVRLEDVCEKASSNVAQKELLNNFGDYNIYGASGLIKKVDFYHQEKEYIAIVKDGAGVGRTMLLPPYSSVIGTMQYILPKSNIDIRFLYYSIVNMNLGKYYMGAAIPHIYFKDYKNEKLPLYDMDIQIKISNILSYIDKLINTINRILNIYNMLIKSRFVEMFGDIIINNKVWNTTTWDKVIVIKNGRNQGSVENPKGKYPICGSGGIIGYADDYIVNENSVIIGRKGNINKPILMREKFWNVDTAFGLEPNKTMLTAEFLYMFCLFYDFERLNKAVTIPSLTKADLLKIIISIPPIELQNQFVDFVKQIDKLKFEGEIYIKNIQNIERRAIYD